MNFSKRIIVIMLITNYLITITNFSKAQSESPIGNWQNLILKGKFSPKISSICEIQVRSNNFNLKYDYFEIKTGISYSFTKQFFGLIGSGIYTTYQVGSLFQSPPKQKEFRTWFELNYKHVLGRLNFEHRGRIEQRFIPGNYKNRGKYRVGINIPVNQSKMVPGSLYLALADELFMPQHGPVVEKNRFYAGGGYKININTAFQLGCISDTDYKSTGHAVKNYLQLLLIYDFSKLLKKHP